MRRALFARSAVGCGLFLALAMPGSTALATIGQRSPTAVTHQVTYKWGSFIHVDKNNDLDAVSCASSRFCVAVDGSGYVQMFHGAKWSKPRHLDSNTYGLQSVSCPSSKYCLALDEEGFAVQWNGSAWTGPFAFDPQSVQPTPAVSCPSPSFCVAVGFGDAVVRSGTVTRSYTVNSSGEADLLTAVSCTSAAFCIAVDNGGGATRWNGAGWSNPAVADTGGALDAVSCVSTTFCMATGAGATSYDGSSWSRSQPISGAAVSNVSCSSAKNCWATDSAGAFYHWNGTRWGAPLYLEGDSFAVACPAAGFCAGVGGADAAFYASRPQVLTSSLPSGKRGTSYSARIKVGDGAPPYSVSATGLPVGLKMKSDGSISGTPQAVGKFILKVHVSDVLGESSTKKVYLTIAS